MLSLTREPLVEEYAVASQVWRLSPADMCEIARMSVLQSGFEAPYKRHWLSKHYEREGPAGNDINLTNVPNIRLQFRHECLTAERALVDETHMRHMAAPRHAATRIISLVPAHA